MAAGLGLFVYDSVTPGASLHATARLWLEKAMKKQYVKRDAEDSSKIQAVTFYYDPLLKKEFANDTKIGLSIAWYLLPQDLELTREIWEAVKKETGWSDGSAGLLPGTFLLNILGLLIAQELGDVPVATKLRGLVEQMAEPRTFGDGEFGYFFHLEEPWPRGQPSSLLACADVLTPGQWRAVFNKTPEQHAARLREPAVEGVEFPSLGISLARNDLDNGTLHVNTYAATPSHAGRQTAFKVNNLPPGPPDNSHVQVKCDGADYVNWQHTSPNCITIQSKVGTHSFVVHTGYKRGATSRL